MAERTLKWAVLCLLTMVGCTLGGLGRYDAPKCNSPKAPTSLDDDPCNGFNEGLRACDRYQCDDATGTCQKRALDFDRDGDPALECGGSDCDDRDSTRTGTGSDVCDGIDNDCTGTADDDAVMLRGVVDRLSLDVAQPSISSDGSLTVAAASAPAAGDRCVITFSADAIPERASCTFPVALPSRAEQPSARPLAGGGQIGAVFAETTPVCEAGSLRYVDSLGGSFSASCDGVNAPAFAPYSDNQTFVVAHVRASMSERRKPIADCASFAPAPLDLHWLRRDQTAAVRRHAQRLNLALTRTISPPSLASFGDGVLLAVPSNESVGLWLLQPPLADGSGNVVVPLLDPASEPGLVGARATSLEVAPSSEGARLAIAAQIGCGADVRIVLWTAMFRTPELVLDSAKVVEVAPSSTSASPRVAWIEKRNEWWVTWTSTDADGSARVRLRRVSKEGGVAGSILTGAPLAGLEGSIAVVRKSTSANDAAAIVSIDGHALVEGAFGCP